MDIDIDRFGMRLPWDWGKDYSPDCEGCGHRKVDHVYPFRDELDRLRGCGVKECLCEHNQYSWDT